MDPFEDCGPDFYADPSGEICYKFLEHLQVKNRAAAKCTNNDDSSRAELLQFENNKDVLGFLEILKSGWTVGRVNLGITWTLKWDKLDTSYLFYTSFTNRGQLIKQILKRLSNVSKKFSRHGILNLKNASH